MDIMQVIDVYEWTCQHMFLDHFLRARHCAKCHSQRNKIKSSASGCAHPSGETHINHHPIILTLYNTSNRHTENGGISLVVEA